MSEIFLTEQTGGATPAAGKRAVSVGVDGKLRVKDSTGAEGVVAMASDTHGASSKTTPVDADELPLADSAASFNLKKLTWANLKAAIAAWIASSTIAGAFTTLSATGNLTTAGLKEDVGGNVAIGMTPSPWGSLWRAFQVAPAGAIASKVGTTIVHLTSNAYNDNALNRYVSNGYAGMYRQLDSVHAWYQAASGLAGDPISFTQPMLLNASGELLIILPTGIGYGAGAGGAVTQSASRTTGVTLNKPAGAITLFTAAGSATATSFTVTNSNIAATDSIILSVKSGTNKYLVFVTAVAAGSFEITFYTTGGTASDTPIINFSVLKAVAA